MFFLMWFIVVVPLLVPTLGTDVIDPADGVSPLPNNRKKRMGNAELCNIENYPSLVSASQMFILDNGSMFAYTTGVLINMDWFLFDRVVWINAHTTILAGSNRVVAEKSDITARYLKRVDYPEKNDDYSDHLSLCKVAFTFKNSSKIVPIRLPPSPGFSRECKNNVTIVGWGSDFENGKQNDLEKKSKALLLSRVAARIIKCLSGWQLNDFCVEPIQANHSFSEQDIGQQVFCKNDTLIGIIHFVEEADNISNRIFVRNISQYMTWLHDVTGVEVAFQSEPIYKLTTPSTTTTTTTTPTTKRTTKDEYKVQTHPKRSSRTTKMPEDDEDVPSGTDPYFKAEFYRIFISFFTCLLITRNSF